MSKVFLLARHSRELLATMMLIAFLALITGCGGSGGASGSSPPPSGNTPPSPPPPPPAAIEGVATPTSVAVVTATNAQ